MQLYIQPNCVMDTARRQMKNHIKPQIVYAR